MRQYKLQMHIGKEPKSPQLRVLTLMLFWSHLDLLEQLGLGTYYSERADACKCLHAKESARARVCVGV